MTKAQPLRAPLATMLKPFFACSTTTVLTTTYLSATRHSSSFEPMARATAGAKRATVAVLYKESPTAPLAPAKGKFANSPASSDAATPAAPWLKSTFAAWALNLLK